LKRGQLFPIAGFVLLVILLAGSNHAAASPANWPMYRNNPLHTGVTADVVPPPLKMKWKQTFGDNIDGSAAVFGSRVYVGSDDNKLRAIDLATGNIIWSYDTDPVVVLGDWNSSPAVETVGGQTIIFAGNDNGYLYAIRDDGTVPFKLWATATGASILSSPIVTTISGTQVVIFGNSAAPGGLYALVASTGALFPGWGAPAANPFTDTGAAGTFISSPAIFGSSLFVGNTNGKVYAINLGNGALLWSNTPAPATSIQSSPAIANVVVGGLPTDVVFIGADDGKLRAYSAASGGVAPLWTFSAGAAQINSSPAIATIPNPPVACAPGPTLAVIFGSEDDNVYAIRASDGTPCWTFPSNGPNDFDSSPSISGETVYIGSADNSFYAINLNSGTWLWSFPALAAIGDPSTTPNAAISGSTVLFGTKAVAGGGTLYAFEPMTVTASTTQIVTVSTTTTTVSTGITQTETLSTTLFTTLISSTWVTSVIPPPAVPGFPIESILAGMVAGLAALGLLRRRHRRQEARSSED
jgi:outer membrane protein assembly factor BamB